MEFVAFANLSIENVTNTTEQINTAMQNPTNCWWVFTKSIALFTLVLLAGISQYEKEKKNCYDFLFLYFGYLDEKVLCIGNFSVRLSVASREMESLSKFKCPKGNKSRSWTNTLLLFCYSLVVIFGQRLDLMILGVISSLYESMTTWHIIHTDKMYMTVHECYEMFYWKIHYVTCDEQLWNSYWKKILSADICSLGL